MEEDRKKEGDNKKNTLITRRSFFDKYLCKTNVQNSQSMHKLSDCSFSTQCVSS